MFNQGSKNQSTQNPAVQSFLESLRKHNHQPAPQSPDFESNFSSFEKFQERKLLEEQRKAEFFQNRTREFHEVFSMKKRQEENQVQQIHEQIKKLSKSMRKLKKEVDVAVQENIPEESIGKQKLTFLDHIKTLIEMINRDVNRTQSWLAMYNQRSRQKSFYWGQVKKSGSSYMLSGERNIATSVG